MQLTIVKKFYDVLRRREGLGPEVRVTYDRSCHDDISKEYAMALLGKAVKEAEASRHDFATLCWIIKDSEESAESSRHGAVLIDISKAERVTLRDDECTMLVMIAGLEYIIENGGPIGTFLAFELIKNAVEEIKMH